MKKDIEIARESELLDIETIAKVADLNDEQIDRYLEKYGKYKAKIDYKIMSNLENNYDGKLVLVTSINPTPYGEGKTTVTIGVSDALQKIGKKTIATLRQPSLGPVFGMKGGATGGGMSQILPMEDINLHFTGDFHAISSANNLLSAMLDNHIHQGNELNIDVRRIVFKRVVDMNDRQLRYIISGLGGKMNGIPHEDGYDITVASEIMAILCLSKDISDLKERLSKIIVAYTYDNKKVTAGDLQASGAMATLLKDALKPNLVQTIYHTPVIIHGGPFANIAHGCNSIMATKMAMKLSDYTITEAGFGSDLGAEKFFDIKCRIADIKPDAVIVVATIRALKYHGGVEKSDLNKENMAALRVGFSNLQRHIENIIGVYKLPCVVAINAFQNDEKEEMDFVIKECEKMGVKAVVSTAFLDGPKGAEDLAKEIIALCQKNHDFEFAYNENDTILEKLNKIATKIYHAKGVNLTESAKSDLKFLENIENIEKYPICVAKTQYSFSDNPKLLAAPSDFEITIRNFKISAGAGFIVALAGNIMTMPGLPKIPAAVNIDVNNDGVISGLF